MSFCIVVLNDLVTQYVNNVYVALLQYSLFSIAFLNPKASMIATKITNLAQLIAARPGLQATHVLKTCRGCRQQQHPPPPSRTTLSTSKPTNKSTKLSLREKHRTSPPRVDSEHHPAELRTIEQHLRTRDSTSRTTAAAFGSTRVLRKP